MENSKDDRVQAFKGIQTARDTRLDACLTHGAFTSTGHSVMGRPFHWSSCPVCHEENEAKKAEEKRDGEAKQAQRQIEERLSRSGIPLRFRGKTFESYIADTDGKERARATAMEFSTSFKKHYAEGATLVFSGKPGTGKSHLAMAIAQSIMPAYTVFYTSAIDAVRMVRDTWRKGAPRRELEVLDDLSGVDLLILDEVGVQYGSDAEQITLFDIIDKRYRDLMPTILLTNQNRAGMKEFLGERSFDRLRESGAWVTFDWASHRGSEK